LAPFARVKAKMATEKKGGARQAAQLSFTRGALETLNAYLTREAAIRSDESKARGGAPLADPAGFVADELREPQHSAIRERVRDRKGRLDKRLMQALLREVAAQHVAAARGGAQTGGVSFTKGARAALIKYMTEEPAVRAFEREEHGADPIDESGAFFTDEIREPAHADIRERVRQRKNRADQRTMEAWTRENSAQHPQIASARNRAEQR
jgi:hypothetical protein